MSLNSQMLTNSRCLTTYTQLNELQEYWKKKCWRFKTRDFLKKVNGFSRQIATDVTLENTLVIIKVQILFAQWVLHRHFGALHLDCCRLSAVFWIIPTVCTPTGSYWRQCYTVPADWACLHYTSAENFCQSFRIAITSAQHVSKFWFIPIAFSGAVS